MTGLSAERLDLPHSQGRRAARAFSNGRREQPSGRRKRVVLRSGGLRPVTNRSRGSVSHELTSRDCSGAGYPPRPGPLTWREGTRGHLRALFVALGVRPGLALPRPEHRTLVGLALNSRPPAELLSADAVTSMP